MLKQTLDLKSTKSLLVQGLQNTSLLLCLFLAGLSGHLWAVNVNCKNCQISFEATLVDDCETTQCHDCQVRLRPPEETATTHAANNTTGPTNSVQTLTFENTNQEAASNAPAEVIILYQRDTALSSDAVNEDEAKRAEGAEGGQCPVTTEQQASIVRTDRSVADELFQEQRSTVNTSPSFTYIDPTQAPINQLISLLIRDGDIDKSYQNEFEALNYIYGENSDEDPIEQTVIESIEFLLPDQKQNIKKN